MGLLVGMLITEANASERLGAIIVLHEASKKLQKLEVVWVDQGYSGENFAQNVQKVCGEKVLGLWTKQKKMLAESLR